MGGVGGVGAERWWGGRGEGQGREEWEEKDARGLRRGAGDGGGVASSRSKNGLREKGCTALASMVLCRFGSKKVNAPRVKHKRGYKIEKTGSPK